MRDMRTALKNNHPKLLTALEITLLPFAAAAFFLNAYSVCVAGLCSLALHGPNKEESNK